MKWQRHSCATISTTMSRETSSVIFSKRSAVAALAAASVVSVGIYGVYAWDWNLEAVTYLAIPICVGIGVIGLHSHHGLKSGKMAGPSC